MWIIVTLKRKLKLCMVWVVTNVVSMPTYIYSTSIEKTAWQTHDGGVSPMITQHDSLIVVGRMLLIEFLKTFNQ